MATSFVLQRLVMRKAVSVCGGDDSLGRVLKVPVAQVRRWIHGEDATPLPLFNQTMRFVNQAYRNNAVEVYAFTESFAGRSKPRSPIAASAAPRCGK